MIKAVLFDYGGVLSEGGKVGALRDIFAKAYGVSPETLRFDGSGLQAIKGLLSDDAFIAIMNERHATGTPATKRHFLAAVEHMPPCRPVLDLAATLRAQGIRTGIASNVLALAVDELRDRGWYAGFDPLVLSCEVHAAKPEPEFYKAALKRLGLDPHEVLFVDDKEEFLVPARKLGMQTVLATSPDQIAADVKDLFKKENNLTL